MSSLFSPFTLYPPFLLIMYDLQQSIQLIKQTSHTCLKRDIKITKINYPHMTDEQILQHRVKYKLPSSIQGSPQWHQSQLQDLLTMVQEFKISHFLKTLTVHEMTQSRWCEFDDMEHFVEQLHKNMSWKDCPR